MEVPSKVRSGENAAMYIRVEIVTDLEGSGFPRRSALQSNFTASESPNVARPVCFPRVPLFSQVAGPPGRVPTPDQPTPLPTSLHIVVSKPASQQPETAQPPSQIRSRETKRPFAEDQSPKTNRSNLFRQELPIAEPPDGLHSHSALSLSLRKFEGAFPGESERPLWPSNVTAPRKNAGPTPEARGQCASVELLLNFLRVLLLGGAEEPLPQVSLSKRELRVLKIFMLRKLYTSKRKQIKRSIETMGPGNFHQVCTAHRFKLFPQRTNIQRRSLFPKIIGFLKELPGYGVMAHVERPPKNSYDRAYFERIFANEEFKTRFFEGCQHPSLKPYLLNMSRAIFDKNIHKWLDAAERLAEGGQWNHIHLCLMRNQIENINKIFGSFNKAKRKPKIS